ncbi:MAG: M67 family metallopeptidase [Bacteroidota bacterium]|nr:M67 family metallopeptidase [Bacteroidota bacterium]MDP4269316.1 M67 family metallopeptidase [Bacteroidota bacterium]
MISIPQYIVKAIIEQAHNELPNEACGLLVGREENVEKRFALSNIDHSPEHFSFDPTEQFNVLRNARKEGLQIIANYHSHPSTPARPSQEDIRLAYDPNILYLILSLSEEWPVLKAFRIQNGESAEVEINVTL